MKEKFGSEIILTNNVIKSIVTVIKSLQNRGILLKGATTKITSSYQKLLVPLMAAGLLWKVHSFHYLKMFWFH